jgi:hypothetical protein
MFFGAPLTAAAAQGATTVDKFTTGFGKQDYTRPALIGATLLEVFYGGQTLQTLVAPADYTFNSATGTIIFTLIVSSNVEANILYQAAP